MVQSPPSSQHPLHRPLLDRGVAVVGGGLAGLAVAIALHRSSLLRSSSSSNNGSCITVLESSSEADFYDPTAGAGVQITPNGLAALQWIAGDAVVKQVLQASSELAHVSMILPSKAALYDNLMNLPDAPPSSKYPTVMIRWGVLRQILVSQLPAGSIVCNQTVTGYHHPVLREESSGSLVRLDISDTNNSDTRSSSVHHGRRLSEPFSLVICANGAASAFRSTPLTASPTDPRLNIKAVVAKRPCEWLPASHTTAYSYFCPVTRIACFCGPAGQQEQNQTRNGNHHNHTNKQEDDDWTYWAISVPMAQCPPAVVQAAAALVDHNHHHNNNNQHQAPNNKTLIQQWLLTTTALASQPEGRAFADLIQATQPPASRIYVQHSTTAELTETFMVTTSTMRETTTMTNAAAAAAVQDDDNDSPMEDDEEETASTSMEAATTTTAPPASPNNNKRTQFLPMVLLGDAGHAMSASYGQATSFAWEDAATLIHALQKQQQPQPRPSDSRLSAALLEYSRLRRNRCIHMQAKSAERAARAVRGDPCHDITQWIHDWRLPDDDDIDNVDSDDNSNNNIRNVIGNNSNNKDDAAGDQPMTVVG